MNVGSSSTKILEGSRMTSLRFVGDMPLWLGLVLALIVAVFSWVYYNRESFDLPRGKRILLPLLRSTAFVLGILILTGPVLHHRKTIGELGKVKVFVDLSESMNQRDKHMGLARKLRIARQHPRQQATSGFRGFVLILCLLSSMILRQH